MRLVQDGPRPPLRRGVSRRFCRAAACLPAALLLAGCGLLGGSSGGLSSGDNQTITVAAVPGVDDAPLYVALREGLFRQRGLHVTITNYSSLRDEIQALGSGRADIAAGDYTDFFTKQSRGDLDLRLITDGYDASPNVMAVLTRPDSGITSPQDLVDKVIATPPAQAIRPGSNLPYSMEMMATQAVLRTDGVGPTSIHWRPTPEKDMISALRDHTVDAIVATEPYLLQAESQLGAVSVLDSCSGVTSGLPLLGYFTVQKFQREHAQVIRAFRSALVSAQAAATMRGPVQKTLTSSMHMNGQSAALLTLGQYPTFLSIGQVQRVADLMYDAGMIGSPLAVRTLVSG